MFLRFGTYDHDDGEIELTITRETQFTEAHVPYVELNRWELSGLIVADDQTDLTTKIRQLEAAYRQKNVDATMMLSATQESAHKLRAATTLGGIRVTSGINYPIGKEAEYTTFRRYTIVLEADIVLGDENGNAVTRFEETIRTWGGGPLFAWTQPIVGVPVRQVVRANTTFKATQTGTAVGLRIRPTPPSAIWPFALMANPEISKKSPQKKGERYQDYETSWNYVYEWDKPLQGEPNLQTLK